MLRFYTVERGIISCICQKLCKINSKFRIKFNYFLYFYSKFRKMSNPIQLAQMIQELKSFKIPISKMEKDVGFSNGLLMKNCLSEEKFILFCKYYSSFFNETDHDHIFYLYKIINPIVNKPFYIGITRQNPAVRMAAHISESRYYVKDHKYKKYKVFNEILDAGMIPTMEIIEIITGKIFYDVYMKALRAEEDTVFEYIRSGYDIVNKIYKKDRMTGRNSPIIDAGCVISNEIKINEECITPKEWDKESIDATDSLPDPEYYPPAKGQSKADILRSLRTKKQER